MVVEHAACLCSGAPLLVVPRSQLQSGTPPKYPLKLAPKEREREEEVERMRREEEEAARSELTSLIRVPEEHRTADKERRITAASRILSAALKRKRKKKKKKFPKTSSRSSSGYGRPCDHQRRDPAAHDVRVHGGAPDPVHLRTLGVPVVTQRQVPTGHAFMLQVLFLEAIDVTVVVLRQVLGSMVQKTGVVPELQFIEGRRHSFRAAEACPLVQSVQQIVEIPQLLFVFWWSMSLLCRSRWLLRCRVWRRQSCSHSSCSLRKSL